MWWKLTLIGMIALVLILAVQPIRTHAVKIDLPLNGQVPQPSRPTIIDLLSNMYVTPANLLLSALIVGIAAYFAFRVIRG